MTRYIITNAPRRWTTTDTHEAAAASREGARVTAAVE